MILNKILNQNILKLRYFLEKKIAKFWGLRYQTPTILPTPTVLLQNVLILSPVSSQFRIAKFEVILVFPLFVILALHFSRSGNGIMIESMAERERMDVFGDARF